MDELLQLPISVSRLLAIVAGLVVLLLVLGSLVSWSIAILVVGFGTLALPFMISIMKSEH